MAQNTEPMDTSNNYSSEKDSRALGESLCQMLTGNTAGKQAISMELMNALKGQTPEAKRGPGEGQKTVMVRSPSQSAADGAHTQTVASSRGQQQVNSAAGMHTPTQSPQGKAVIRTPTSQNRGLLNAQQSPGAQVRAMMQGPGSPNTLQSRPMMQGHQTSMAQVRPLGAPATNVRQMAANPQPAGVRGMAPGQQQGLGVRGMAPVGQQVSMVRATNAGPPGANIRLQNQQQAMTQGVGAMGSGQQGTAMSAANQQGMNQQGRNVLAQGQPNIQSPNAQQLPMTGQQNTDPSQQVWGSPPQRGGRAGRGGRGRGRGQALQQGMMANRDGGEMMDNFMGASQQQQQQQLNQAGTFRTAIGVRTPLSQGGPALGSGQSHMTSGQMKQVPVSGMVQQQGGNQVIINQQLVSDTKQVMSQPAPRPHLHSRQIVHTNSGQTLTSKQVVYQPPGGQSLLSQTSTQSGMIQGMPVQQQGQVKTSIVHSNAANQRKVQTALNQQGGVVPQRQVAQNMIGQQQVAQNRMGQQSKGTPNLIGKQQVVQNQVGQQPMGVTNNIVVQKPGTQQNIQQQVVVQRQMGGQVKTVQQLIKQTNVGGQQQNVVVQQSQQAMLVQQHLTAQQQQIVVSQQQPTGQRMAGQQGVQRKVISVQGRQGVVCQNDMGQQVLQSRQVVSQAEQTATTVLPGNAKFQGTMRSQGNQGQGRLPANMATQANVIQQGAVTQANLSQQGNLTLQGKNNMGLLPGNMMTGDLQNMQQLTLQQQQLMLEALAMGDDDEDEDEEEEDEDDEFYEKENGEDSEEYYLVAQQFYVQCRDIDRQSEDAGLDPYEYIERLMRDKVGDRAMDIVRTVIPKSRVNTEPKYTMGQSNAESMQGARMHMSGQEGSEVRPGVQQQQQPPLPQQQQQQQPQQQQQQQQVMMANQQTIKMQHIGPGNHMHNVESQGIAPPQMNTQLRQPGIQQPRPMTPQRQAKQVLCRIPVSRNSNSPGSGVVKMIKQGSRFVVNTARCGTGENVTMVNQVGSSDEAGGCAVDESQQNAISQLVQTILSTKQDIDPMLSSVLSELGSTQASRSTSQAAHTSASEPKNHSNPTPAVTAAASLAQNSNMPTAALQNTSQPPPAVATPAVPRIAPANNADNLNAQPASEDSTVPYVKGSEYSILYSNGVQVRAVWDGQYFKLKSNQGSSGNPTAGSCTAPDSNQSTGGSVVTMQAADSTTPTTTAANNMQAGGLGEQGAVRGGGANNAAGQQDGRTLQPGRSDGLPLGPGQSLYSPESTGSEDSETSMETLMPSNKRPLKQALPTDAADGKSEAGKFAVCPHCGGVSANYNNCDNCKKTLPNDPRYYYPGKVARTDTDESAPDAEAAARSSLVEQVVSQTLAKANMVYAVDKKQFYGAKAATATYKVQVDNIPRIIANHGRRLGTQRIRVMTRKPSRVTKPRRPMEPEMVTISSDEDDDGSGMFNPNRMGLEGEAGSNPASESPSSSRSVTPSAHAAGGLSRRERMEDEVGDDLYNTGRVRTPEEDADDEGEDMSKDDATRVTLEPRSIRIGSLRLGSFSPVMFSQEGIHFTVEVGGEVNACNTQIHLDPKAIQQVKVHPGTRMPVLFLKTTQEAGQVIREKCNIKVQQPDGPYFDPGSSDDTHKQIVILLHALHESKDKLFNIMSAWPEPEDKTMRVQEIEFDEANMLLTQSVPTSIVQAQGPNPLQRPSIQIIQTLTGIQLVPYSIFNDDCDEDSDEEPMDRSRSPSPPLSGFCGTITKLFTYPPPPATGGITCTNEDLFCLNEGEFLNDVIIDFYLKYLFIEKLTAEDRARTHVFSSFFYRRLSQRNKRLYGEEENTKQTPQQKRHSRVRTWSRHVDLFSKDFIIVPINESAHWYLAIICFPSLLEPEYAASDKGGKTQGVPDKAGQTSDSAEKTVKSDKTDSKAASEKTEGEKSKDDKLPNTDQSSDGVNNSSQDPSSKSSNSSDSSDKKKSCDSGDSGGSVRSPAEAMTDNRILMQTKEDVSDEVKQVLEQVMMEKLQAGLKQAKEESGEAAKETSKDSPADGDKPAEKAADEKAPESSEGTSSGAAPAAAVSKENGAKATPGKGKGGNTKGGAGKKSSARVSPFIKKQACILVFDSLSGPSRTSVVRTLRDYIAVEWEAKKQEKLGPRVFDKETMRGANPRCPQQTNYSDCGVYLLQYVQSFFEDPITCYNLPMKQLENWFPEERVRQKRLDLQNLILSFQKKLNPNLAYDPTKDILT